jgi:8-amino-7-oxononanoate synthase
MNALSRRLRDGLAQRRRDELYRQRLTVAGAQGPEIMINGSRVLSFCSNDYLGLANHPKMVASMQEAVAKYGVGSGASHLVSGHSAPHQELEEALAEFTGRDRVLLFSGGYMANMGVLSALLGAKDYVFQDRLNHASLLDGGLASGARFRRFAHNGVGQLETLLQGCPEEAVRLVVVDGVFSMDGDAAPLGELAALCREENASLMVDDAHGFGVLGARGGGSLEQAGLDQEDVPIMMATLSKALGSAGAFVAGSEDLIEFLIQFARTYIYTTAMPPAVAAAGVTALGLLEEESWRRQYLQLLITRFRHGAQQLGLNLLQSNTPIQPLMVGDAREASLLSERLLLDDILISAIRPPTVPDGSSRLRITLSASHTEAHVDRLLEALSTVLP